MRIFDSQEMRKHATESDPWSHQYVDEQTARVLGPIARNAGLKATNLSYCQPVSGKEPQHQANCVQASPLSSNRFVIMKMGEADLSDRLTPREFEALAGLDNLKVIGLTGNETLFLHMNFKSPPFDNPLIGALYQPPCPMTGLSLTATALRPSSGCRWCRRDIRASVKISIHRPADSKRLGNY